MRLRYDRAVRRYSAGFTALELMISLVIGSILLAIAVPSMISLVNSSRLQTENGTLYYDLMYARAESIRRAAPVSVCPSTDGATCNSGNWGTGRIVFSDSNNAGVVDGTDTVLHVSPAINGKDTITFSANVNFIQFTPSGQVNSNGTFTTCRSGVKGYTVTVNAIGRAGTSRLGGACP